MGNDPIWSNNPECPGGPFLRSDFKDFIDESDTVLASDKLVPGYGFEAWCNLPGRFTFFRATGLPSISPNVCSIAVTGTKYVRDKSVVEFQEVDSESLTTVNIMHVYSERPIGNILAINLR